jgi:hypothetical protein
MKHVSVVELLAPVAVQTEMTRQEKLLHWASIVRAYPGDLALYHNLEYLAPTALEGAQVVSIDRTAFGLAAGNSVFNRAGLPGRTTIAGIMRFFGLTQAQLHEFSCDCGGAIDNDEMASRIEHLAK